MNSIDHPKKKWRVYFSATVWGNFVRCHQIPINPPSSLYAWEEFVHQKDEKRFFMGSLVWI